jgi:hypothetical protein
VKHFVWSALDYALRDSGYDESPSMRALRRRGTSDGVDEGAVAGAHVLECVVDGAVSGDVE